MATSDKLTYLNTTKGLIKDAINNAGANITNDTFRSYANTLNTKITKMRSDRDTLLEKSTIGTSTGSITNALEYPIYEDKMSKLSTQDETPSPSNPVEVKTVKGYRNLFDKTNITSSKYLNDTGNSINSNDWGYSDYIELTPDKNYYVSGLLGKTGWTPAYCLYDSSKTFISGSTTGNKTEYLFTTTSNAKYIRFSFKLEDLDTIILNEGSTSLPYVPYGTNWIYTTITDGVNTKQILLPLNDNEIVGIGDYKDELIVDKNGHCWLNKKTGKSVLNGTENWSYIDTSQVPFELPLTNLKRVNNEVMVISNYFKGVTYSSNWSSPDYLITTNSLTNPTPNLRLKYLGITSVEDLKTWLSTHNTEVYYVLATENLIDLNYNVDLTLYEGTNTIINSEDMDMAIKYVEDINTILATLTTPSNNGGGE